MKTVLITLLSIVGLLISVTGCTPESEAAEIEVGELVTETRSVELGRAKSVSAEIFMGGGELNVTGGAEELLEADLTYNVGVLEPKIKYRGGKLVVRHPDIEFKEVGSLWDLENLKCEWDLRLNDQVPMDMSVTVGAGEAYLDVGSLSLTGLEVATGAGNVTVDVSGATSLTRLHLGMGAGNVIVDLTGKWKHDMDVDLEGLFGTLTVLLPQETGVRVDVEGAIGSVIANGMTRDGDEFVNEAYGEAESALLIDIAGGVGQVNLEVRE